MKWLTLFVTTWIVGCGAFAIPGRACRKHEECKGLERGYCAKAEICTRECSEAQPCPDNSTCSLQVSRSVCLPKCEVDTDCLAGFQCLERVCQVKAPLEPPAK